MTFYFLDSWEDDRLEIIIDNTVIKTINNPTGT